MNDIRVLFFAGARTAAGCAETFLPGDVTGWGEDFFWARLLVAHPALAAVRDTTRLAVNGEYFTGGARIRAGDEVALIPPVSGG